MKIFAFSALLGATFCLTGCFSLEKSSAVYSNEEQVVVRNYGWKLFYSIPLVCGNADENSSFPWVFFRNDVTMDKMQRQFIDFAAKQGKTPSKIVYNTYDTVLWEIPLVNVPVPIPYLLCYNEIQLSGQIK